MGMTIEEKQNLINMFREQIFPSQARTLLKQNFENKGELDKQEYLRDTTALLDLAEKGLQIELIQSDYEARLKADMVAMLEDLRLDIEELPSNHTFIDGLYDGGYRFGLKEVNELVQECIDTLRGEEK